MSDDSSCDKEVTVKIGKGNATFEKLNQIRKSKEIKLKTKIRLVVKTSLLYGSETSIMTAANRKKLDAVPHKRLRRILKVKWTDEIKNEEIRRKDRSMQTEKYNLGEEITMVRSPIGYNACKISESQSLQLN